MDIDSIAIYIILIISTVSTVVSFFISAVQSLGIPRRLNRYFARNRLNETIEILKELGVDTDRVKRRLYRDGNAFPSEYTYEELQEIVRQDLYNYCVSQKTIVGKQHPITLPYYYDLTGALTQKDRAEAYARYLSSFYQILKNKSLMNQFEFDFVAAPKKGSSTMAYEFAELYEVPLALHEPFRRFENPDKTTQESLFQRDFSCFCVPPQGSKVLIIDDSTTRGSMVTAVYNSLKKCGYDASNCLVVFVPKTGIDVKDRIQKETNNSLTLYSIIETHNENDKHWVKCQAKLNTKNDK